MIAGHDTLDPTSSHEKVPDYEATLDGKLGGLKIGVATTHFLENADQPVALAFDEAVGRLAKRGATVRSMALPFLDAIHAYVNVVMGVEAATIHAEWMRIRPQDYAPHTSSWLYASCATPGTYYVEALSRRGLIPTEFLKEVFGRVDVLATPTIPICIPTLAETDVDKGPADAHARSSRIWANTAAFNYLGLPSVSVNCGFDPNGLPIGISFTVRPFAEACVLKVADAYQQETDWHRRRPLVLA